MTSNGEEASLSRAECFCHVSDSSSEKKKTFDITVSSRAKTLALFISICWNEDEVDREIAGEEQ